MLNWDDLIEKAQEAQANWVPPKMVKEGTNPTGFCIRCDKVIPAARLAVVPRAEHCVKCQGLVDKKVLTR